IEIACQVQLEVCGQNRPQTFKLQNGPLNYMTLLPRFHDLRHPDVKLSAKNKGLDFLLKAETPDYQTEVDSLEFLFLICTD
ncbi:MAG: hypothetical protein RR413_09185, partial [Christensenellaceae bacterium]